MTGNIDYALKDAYFKWLSTLSTEYEVEINKCFDSPEEYFIKLEQIRFVNDIIGVPDYVW